MSKFFTLSFWFNANAGSLEPNNEKILLIVLGIFLILAVFVSLNKKAKQNGLLYKVYDSLQIFFISNLVFGAILYFFTYQGIYFLSARFWFIVWVATIIAWLNFIRLAYQKIPKIKAERKQKDEYNKYIP